MLSTLSERRPRHAGSGPGCADILSRFTERRPRRAGSTARNSVRGRRCAPSGRHPSEIRSRSCESRWRFIESVSRYTGSISRYTESLSRSDVGASVTLREPLSVFAETPSEHAERLPFVQRPLDVLLGPLGEERERPSIFPQPPSRKRAPLSLRSERLRELREPLSLIRTDALRNPRAAAVEGRASLARARDAVALSWGALITPRAALGLARDALA
jgi:hypothetical protein